MELFIPSNNGIKTACVFWAVRKLF